MTRYWVACFVMVVFIAAAFVAISAAHADDEDGIHIDDYPAYACIGDGCP